MARAFNMNSVGGSTIKTSRRKLDRLARARGFRSAKAMLAAMFQEQFRKQLANPAAYGSLEPVKEAA
jgi:hypothetical protein